MTKQRRRTARPRIATLPQGWRWPATSPGTALAGSARGAGSGRRPSAPRRSGRRRPRCTAASWLPAIQTQSRPSCSAATIARSPGSMRSGPRASWKESPSATTQAGIEARHHLVQAGQGLAGVVGRQELAGAGRVGRALLQVEIGDDQRPVLGQPQAAAEVEGQGLAGQRQAGGLVGLLESQAERQDRILGRRRGRADRRSGQRLFEKLRLGLGQDLVGALAVDPLAPDLEHHGDGERRDAVESLVDDSPLDALSTSCRGASRRGVRLPHPAARPAAGGGPAGACAARRRPGRWRS